MLWLKIKSTEVHATEVSALFQRNYEASLSLLYIYIHFYQSMKMPFTKPLHISHNSSKNAPLLARKFTWGVNLRVYTPKSYIYVFARKSTTSPLPSNLDVPDRPVCYGLQGLLDLRCLAHWGRDKMDAFSQTTLSNAFSWMKILEFRLKCHWSLFLRVLLTIFQHWFWKWLGADQATSHYLNQCWLDNWRIYASLGLNVN